MKLVTIMIMHDGMHHRQLFRE